MGKPQNQQVVDILIYFRMVDLLGHFRQLLRFRLKQTWWQVHQSKLLCSWCNNILGSDLWIFMIVGIRDLGNFSFKHFSLRARLLWRPTHCHSSSIQGWQAFPNAPPAYGTTTASRRQVPVTEGTEKPLTAKNLYTHAPVDICRFY